MKINLRKYIFLLFFIYGQQAFGGLFVEPYMGYALGVQDYKLKSGSTDQNISSYSAPNGLIMGGRVGMSLGPLYFTGDFSGYSWDGSIPGATPSTAAGSARHPTQSCGFGKCWRRERQVRFRATIARPSL